MYTNNIYICIHTYIYIKSLNTYIYIYMAITNIAHIYICIYKKKNIYIYISSSLSTLSSSSFITR